METAEGIEVEFHQEFEDISRRWEESARVFPLRPEGRELMVEMFRDDWIKRLKDKGDVELQGVRKSVDSDVSEVKVNKRFELLCDGIERSSEAIRLGSTPDLAFAKLLRADSAADFDSQV